MVKFSKELEAQLIPEWKEAFVNYWQLKKQIKRIKLSKIPKQNHNHAEGGGSIFNSLCFLVKKISLKLSPESDHDNTNIIKVLYKLRFFLCPKCYAHGESMVRLLRVSFSFLYFVT